MAEEFKIGRLRYTWKGYWADGIFYNRDAVISYEGKTYVCLEPHTSTNFQADLTYVTGGGESRPRWLLMIDGRAWKQAWEPDTYYFVGNIVTYSGVVYICATQHTSGPTAIDLTKWTVYSQFDNWSSNWTPLTVYGFGDIVRYGGIVYRCTVDHVAASSTSAGLEADLSKWEVVSAGIEYKQVWAESTRYKLNDLVKSGTDIYICTLGHTSTSTFDPTKWELWFPGQQYTGGWSSTVVYQPGDIVVYGGYSYICKVINNSNNIPSTEVAEWELVTEGYRMRNQWDSGAEYRIGDVVRHGGTLYSAIADSTSEDPTDYSVTTTKQAPVYNWNPIVFGGTVSQGPAAPTPGQYYVVMNFAVPPSSVPVIDAWEVGQTMTLQINGTIPQSGTLQSITGGGGSYTAILDETFTDYGTVTNITFTGVDTGNQLTVQSTANIVRGMTVTGAGFSQGQLVASVDGLTTITLSDPPNDTILTGQNIEFIGVNHPYWVVVVPGTTWKGFWTTGTVYVSGEVVVWQNATYKCIKSHTASSVFRPDLDTTNIYWVAYALHAKENAGNTQGDLVSFKDGAPTAIHILPDGAEEGATEKYLLRVTGTQPVWTRMFVLPDVFYVATDGVDEPDLGRTVDQPWASVAYACEQVAKGFFFQNANELLVNNKDFLVEEMYQWMLNQKANNTTPFTTSSVFDEYSTRRDAKFVIDAVSHDIVRGSNSRIVTATRAYFKENSNSSFFNEDTDAAQAYIVASLRKLEMMISDILDNTDPTINYQKLTIVWDSGTTYQTDDIIYDDGTGDFYISLIDDNTDVLTVTESWALIPLWDGLTAFQTGEIAYHDGTFYTSLIDDNLDEVTVEASWEVITGAPVFIEQYKNLAITVEANSYTEITSLMDILINAIEFASTDDLPLINQGQTATINVKTGTYSEPLPIVVPDNTAIVGDELRGTVIQPASTVYTSTRSSSSVTNRFTLQSVVGLEVGMPIQFSAATVNDDFGGVNLGFTYYVINITNKTIQISETVGGDPVTLTSGFGLMTVYAGDCLKDMFYMRNATGMRNCTLTGLAGSLGAPNTFTTQRPTGGAYTSLDPGTGPEDTRAWIVSRSPYIQNVTTFGVGCTGMKIDGRLHNGGNRSMVANDYTQILSDGIGVWCTGPRSLTECVSVFSYYNYAGYFAEDGGRIRATNGNSSYGTYGVVAEGYDDTEVPISGVIDNRSDQVQASVQSAFGTNAELLSVQFSNAGSAYAEQTTNLLKYSNLFTSTWVNDGNVNIQKNTTSPFGNTDAWTLTGNTSSTDTSYIYQNISILPAGIQYSNLTTVNVTGSGIGATFDITVGSTGYSAVVNTGGSGYVNGSELRIPGSSLGGVDGANDCFLTVTSLSGSAVLGVSVTGTVPTNSNLGYTISAYVKQGTSPSVDIAAIFSGSTTATTLLNYNFLTETFTPSVDANGALPKSYDKLELTNGWYRIWMTVYDKPALNSTLQVRIYPRSKTGLTGSTRIYGLQAQVGDEPTFYLETNTNQYASYANYTVTGSGTGADLLGDEIRSNAVFETRITDTGTGTGGRGYLIASNTAQGGDDQTILLAGSDTNLASNYIGMRVFIQSGTGAGQYGYISAFDDAVTKSAEVLKDSFVPLNITSTDVTGNIFTLSAGNTDTLYLNQPVQFIPTYYNTSVTNTSIDSLTINEVVGGSTNIMIVDNTAKLTVNMPIQFSGSIYGGVTTNFTYYIREILSETSFTISSEIYGSQWLLNSGTGTMTMTFPGYNNYIYGSTANMQVNMPIQFTGVSIGGLVNGTTYYVNEVISGSKFTISSTLTEITATATSSGTNYITTSSTAALVPMNPIKFTGSTFGNITTGSTYYINKVVNSTSFTVASSLTEVQATATETLTNLITVSDTTGFVVNNPIQFIGNTTGGIVNGTTYYILAINDGTSFTISTTPGGSAVNLSTSVCDVLVRTAPAATTLTTASGSMTGTTTNAKSVLSTGYGSMSGTYSTNLFGNAVAGTTYYVKTIPSSTTFTVSDTSGGTAVTLKTDTGSMNVAAVGWDHIHPGTPIETQLDNSTVYYVEPRITYEAPGFSQTASTINTAALGTAWASVAYGNGKFIALPNGNSIAGVSTDGATWEALSLPATASWSGIAYGNGYWSAISSGGLTSTKAIYSINNGEGWRETQMPSASTWSDIAYGNGKFVAIATGTANSAYSTNYGKDWSAGSGLPNATWTGLTFGKGKFIAVASGGTTGAYSNNGTSWTSMTLPASTTWSDIAYGNGIFIAVSSTSARPAYSQNGTTWYQSPYTIDGVNKITYGEGVFVAISSTAGTAYTSEDGIQWTKRTVSNDSYGAMTYGYIGADYEGVFVTVAGQTTGSTINAGCRTKGRATVTSGSITGISLIEPGSNYSTAPAITIRDPNVTISASTSVRIGNGALANPTFISSGQDYNTNSTAIAINGGGYADTFQRGLTLIVKNLSSLPAPGDNLVIADNSKIYKVTNATPVYGTVAPNIKANIQISPEMTVALSPVHEAAVTIRTKYSQARLTGHDFLNVGYGNAIESNYPNLPPDTVLAPQDQAVEANYGRVFYTSTDQDGNFKVGDLFGVEQATGIVTLSATQFGLTGLETLSLGGIAVGGASVIVRQFSTDSTFIANSNSIIPTQRAIKAYLTARLSQGGANTFTGQLIAGTVVVGGADKIRSTIPEGLAGWVVNMPVMTRFQGQFAGWDGDGMALSYFMKSFHRRAGTFGR